MTQPLQVRSRGAACGEKHGVVQRLGGTGLRGEGAAGGAANECYVAVQAPRSQAERLAFWYDNLMRV